MNINLPFSVPAWARWAIAISAGLALLGGLILWLGAREEADDTHNQAVGAAVEREAVQAETITKVQEANHARDEIASDTDHARYDQCVRTARTPANCQRFLLPGGQADKR